MVHFACDDAQIQKALEKLYTVLDENDAYFHPDLSVVYKNNSFAVHGGRSIPNQNVVAHVPHTCLIDINRFGFSVCQGRINIDSAHESTTALEQELASIVMEIYSLSDKIKHFQNHCVYSVYYEDPHLFHALCEGLAVRSENDLACLSPDNVFFRGFLDIRTLNASKKRDEHATVIVPIIEYFNHHQRAQQTQMMNLKTPSTHSRGMGAFSYMPTNSDQIFINYGSYDAHELLMYEGFLDTTINAVKSVPLGLSVNDININVYKNSLGPFYKDLPSDVADLHGYMPHFSMTGAHAVKFNFLYIPDHNAPRSLRRILLHGLRGVVENDDQARTIMQAVEHEIIMKNLLYYDNLKNDLKRFKSSSQTKTFITDVVAMVDTQLSIIKKYHFFDDAMAYKPA